ncbi:MAG: hypothetical protein WBN29_00190, partial [Polyangiales bacterium]
MERLRSKKSSQGIRSRQATSTIRLLRIRVAPIARIPAHKFRQPPIPAAKILRLLIPARKILRSQIPAHKIRRAPILAAKILP